MTDLSYSTQMGGISGGSILAKFAVADLSKSAQVGGYF